VKIGGHSAEQIQEINEIRVEQRNLYYKYRFWIVGGIPYVVFVLMLGLLNVREFSGPREDYPIFFYVAILGLGLALVWLVIEVHKIPFPKEDPWLWKQVNLKAKEKHKQYKSMSDADFSGIMKAVGMRGGKEDD